MNTKDFNNFFNQLKESNLKLEYFVDFEKVINNVDAISHKLYQLNFLLGKEDLKEAINILFEKNPTVFDALNILVAIRDTDKKVVDSFGKIIHISDYLSTPDLIYQYLKRTGLSKIFINKNITNLVDYVVGIEVGLDTNARKNRGGNIMVEMIESLFTENEIAYRKEVSSTSFKDIESLGVDKKTFDFMVEASSKKYLIEVNYYNSGGSKLNEVARAYITLSDNINKYENYEFVWITDGQGWHKAKTKLEEAYKRIPKVYNLESLKDFIQLIHQESKI